MRPPVLPAIVLAALTGACGGAGGAGGEAPAPPVPAEQGLSKADFTLEANRICAQTNRALKRYGKRKASFVRRNPGRYESREEVEEIAAREVKRLFRPYLERLRRLEPPRELERGWERFLDQNERSLRHVEDDKRTERYVERTDRSHARFVRRAGLTECFDERL